jgi:hypothetical protein
MRGKTCTNADPLLTLSKRMPGGRGSGLLPLTREVGGGVIVQMRLILVLQIGLKKKVFFS